MFKYLLHKKAARPDQIARDIFPGVHKSAVYRRLQKLRNANYIENNSIHLEGRPQIFYHLSLKGLSILDESGRYSFAHPRLKSDSVAHDLDLVDLDHHIGKLRVVEDFFTENEIKSYEHFGNSKVFQKFQSIETDRILLLNLPEKIRYVGLEFEKSRKSKERYRSKILDYYLAKEIDAVFYICESNGTKDLIKKIDFEFSKDFSQKVYFTTLNCVFSSDKTLKLERHNGRSITMD